MMRPLLFGTTFAAITASLAPAAFAGPTVCIPEAIGVPTMSGPPMWAPWPGMPGAASTALDDPRWQGAAGQSYQLGSAKAPLHTRALWGNSAGKDYLYLSFLVDIEALSGAGATTPRDLFIGFRRAAALGTGERAYIFQFHLNADPATGPVAPSFCANYADCEIGAGTGVTPNYWRVFTDFGGTGTCAATGATGEKFRATADAGTTLTWMSDAVRFWKIDDPASPLLHNRWAVQVRFPIADAGQPLTEGIERGSSMWYEATTRIGGAGGGPFASVGRWPRTVDRSICPEHSEDPNYLIHERLGDAANYSPLHLYSGSFPVGALPDGTTCGRGLSIETADIGAVFEAPAPATGALTTMFRALKADGTPGTNTVVARVRNNGAAATAPLLARFRLASWGAAPWSTSDPGKWKDLRPVPSGVCASGAAPGCTPTAMPSGGTTVLSFPWQLGNDPTLGASEYCKYGLTPPAGQGTCQVCSCAGVATCDASGDPGVQSTRPGSGLWPCVSKNYVHQCLLVELSAPNGGVDFERQSAWNNMNFGQMSILSREALIDARGLPVAQGQKEHELYLVAMPRNMPSKLAAPVTGGDFVGKQAFAAAQRLIEPYRKRHGELSPEEKMILAQRLKRRLPTPDELRRDKLAKYFGEDYLALQEVRALAAADDYQRSGRLLELAGRAMGGQVPAEQLTREVVEVVGPSVAAEVVPTLEIYAFHQQREAGRVYQPMTSFAVFLSHEGAMNGITWELDGAEKVSENVYRLRIPVGFAKRIQVRSQALEPGEAVQAPGNRAWPCGGGCCCRDRGLVAGLGDMAPTLLGLSLFGVPRRRKKSRAAREG